MERDEEITQAIYAAIDEVNTTLELEEPLEQSHDTILVGQPPRLNSLAFITLITTVEEQIEQRLDERISVMDVVIDVTPPWTVADMARAIAELIDGNAPGARLPEESYRG